MSFSALDQNSAPEMAFDPFDDRDLETSFERWEKKIPSPSNLKAPPTIAGEVESQRDIVFYGTLIVNSHIAGEIFSDAGELVIDRAGRIDGDISAASVTIHGNVRGDIRASGKVELASTARVIGDIETAELLLHPGAEFEGHCTAHMTSVPAETAACDTADILEAELAMIAR